MFKFMKRDPLEKAKKHVEKALAELDDDYPDYASVQFEKAAQLFLQNDRPEFAVKYYREAAYAALQADDHLRAAEMKIAAAEVLLSDKMYDEAGMLYSEASDHLNREKKFIEANRNLAIAILCLLASRNFDTAVNLFRKAEKRVGMNKKHKTPEHDFANQAVRVLFEGVILSKDHLDRLIKRLKPKPVEQDLIDFVCNSVQIANSTDVRIEWAGPEKDSVCVKEPIEFELLYRCPVPVKVTHCRFDLSSSIRFSREPVITNEPATDESWLFEVIPVLSGDGQIGPFKLTLEGESILAHKVSNSISLRISRAPADLDIDLHPRRVSCDLGDEAVFDITVINNGEGPADNIELMVLLSDGLEMSMGSTEKIINFLGANEKMHFQIFVKGVGLGDETITIKVRDPVADAEIVKQSVVVVE